MPVRTQNAWKRRFLRFAFSKEGPRLRTDRELLGVLVKHSKVEGRVVVSIDLLAEMARLNQKTVRVGLTRLRDAGWLRTQPMTWGAVQAAFPNVRMPRDTRVGNAPAPNLYTVLDGNGCLACETYAQPRKSSQHSTEKTSIDAERGALCAQEEHEI
jgi:hypothetical protein